MPRTLSGLIRALLVATSIGACNLDAEKPPLPEVLVVVDTNVPVPLVAARLRVDLYDDRGVWFDSTDFGRPDIRDWPASFSVYSEDESRERTIWIRLRTYPEGAVDTYLGERLRDVRNPFAPVPPTYGPRLVREGRDVTPEAEPSPLLTVDRLVRVVLRPETRGRVRVLLHGGCVGTMVNMGDGGTPSEASESCIDTPKERVRVEVSPLEADLTRPESTAAGTWLTGRCPPRKEGESRVCVPGGATVLGSRENSDYTPGGTAQLDSAPPRVFGLTPFYVDVDEMTVGALRAIVAAGYSGALPLANDGPIGEFTAANPSAVCTWSFSARDRDDYPITCASYRASRAICKHLGGDILTEAQYEHVATIAGFGRKVRYPWGQDAPTCDRGVWGRRPLGPSPPSCPLGSGPRRIAESAKDLTPLGIRGLYGSVTEWAVDDAFPYASPEWAAVPIVDPRIDKGGSRRVLRGMSWQSDGNRPISRLSPPQDEGYGPLGFRCAYPTERQ